MGNNISEKRKEELKTIQKQLKSLNSYIQDVIDGKSSMSKAAYTLRLTPQEFNKCIGSGLYALTHRLKIVNHKDIEQLLRDSSSPIEKLMNMVIGCSDRLIILNTEEEEKVIKILQEKLDERHYEIIKLYIGLDCEPMCIYDIASNLSISSTRVRQICAEVIRKLRMPSTLKMLLPDYDLLIEELKDTRIMNRLNLEMQAQIASINKCKNDTSSISELDLSARAYSCLTRAGINSIDELSRCSIRKLENVRNLGVKTLNEIVEALNKKGITLVEE